VKKVVYSASGAAEEDAAPADQAGAAQDGSSLHISGPVSSESQYVKMGAYHTLDLEAGRDFTLIKEPGGWDSVGIDRVNESTAVAGGAEVGAIVCGEGEPRPFTAVDFQNNS
jgi:protein pelota